MKGRPLAGPKRHSYRVKLEGIGVTCRRAVYRLCVTVTCVPTMCLCVWLYALCMHAFVHTREHADVHVFLRRPAVVCMCVCVCCHPIVLVFRPSSWPPPRAASRAGGRCSGPPEHSIYVCVYIYVYIYIYIHMMYA